MQSERSAIDLRTLKEVAELLGVSVECLIRWRRVGDGPPFIRLGSRKIAYEMRDVAAWLNSRQRYPKDERGCRRKDAGAVVL